MSVYSIRMGIEKCKKFGEKIEKMKKNKKIFTGSKHCFVTFLLFTRWGQGRLQNQVQHL